MSDERDCNVPNPVCQVTLSQMAKQIDEIHKCLTGNGTPEKGLIIRVDRIEQKWKYLAGAFGMAVTAFGKVVYDWIKP